MILFFDTISFYEYKNTKKFYTYKVNIELGETFGFLIGKRNSTVKFIKVTAKGFNFLNLETSKCIFKRHLYSKDFVGIDVPYDVKYINVQLPYWIQCIDEDSRSIAKSELLHG